MKNEQLTGFHKVVIKNLFILLLVILNAAIGNGLPGEYLLSDQWRALFLYYSPISNPALLTDRDYTELRGVVSVSADDVADLWEGGVTVPLGLYQSAGLTVVGENGKGIQGGVYDDALDQIIESGEIYKNNNLFVVGTYANNLWSKLSIGLNLNLAYQSNFGKPSIGIGADAGVTYRIMVHPVFGYHLAGVSYKNIISSGLSGVKFPAQIGFQYHSALFNKRIEIDGQFDMKDLFSSDELFTDGKKIEWDLKLQGGWNFLTVLSLKAFTQISETKKLDYWGFAAGINIPQTNNGRDLVVLYQFRDNVEDDLRSSHTVYIRVDIGKHREELFAKHVAVVSSLSANDLYNKAMRLYSREAYFDAYFLFERIQTEYPDFFLNDMVSYYAGSCLEEMDMREAAEKRYLSAREDYPLSKAVPMEDLGMMRIYYRQDKLSEVEQQFAELSRLSVPDSIRQHGAYIMGATMMKKGEYSIAMQYFKLVEENHPDYVFAQHSTAIALALTNAETSLIVSALENCVASTPKTKTQKEIVNRSLVLLGYIFYEENTMSKCVMALRMVPQESYYYEDALLGLGWSGIKARQWSDCKTNGQMLVSFSRKTVLQCEGALLQAYSTIMEKRYTDAATILQIAINKLKDFTPPSEDSLNYVQMQYESDRMAYQLVADNVTSTARKGAAASEQEILDLRTKQEKVKSKIDWFLKYKPEFSRVTFFSRNAEKVMEDLEYAYATVQKIMGSSSVIKEQKAIESKQKEIDEELDQLRRQMEQAE